VIIAHHLNNDFTGSTRVFSAVLDATDLPVFLITSGKHGFINGYKCVVKTRILPKLKFTALNLVLSNIYAFFRVITIKQFEIQYSSTILCFGGAIAAKIRGKRLLLHQHEIGLGNNYLFKFLVIVWNKLNPEIIVVSNFMLALKTINTNKGIYLLQNCLPKYWINPNEAKKEFNGKVLMLASCRKYKGIIEFIETATLDKGRKYILALSDLDNTIISSVVIPTNLELHINPLDVGELYSSVGVVLNLSIPEMWIETFGMTIIEGMWHGCPVIAPNYGGPKEIIIPGHNGYLLESVNPGKILEYLSLIELDYSNFSANALNTSRRFEFLEFKNKLSLIWNKENN
jgi:glycosyltransferase involved in cell wall biosynthesis